jgi:hypothetical protein
MGQLEALMKLGMSEAEAKEVLEADRKIDKGEKMSFDLTKEQEKATRAMRQADRKPFVPKLDKRERKPNEPKRELIQTITDALIEQGMIDDSSLHIENVERQIDFAYNGVRYRIVLSAPRK